MMLETMHGFLFRYHLCTALAVILQLHAIPNFTFAFLSIIISSSE